MSANWTEKQLEAIDHSDGAAIVSAAAGSGKTAVLVERVIRLITDEEKHIDADKLVVATFTEKAAGELQTRLQKALNEALAKNPSDSYIRSQRVKLEDASISTISSFCMKLIRENSSFLGLSPDFSVVDEAEGQLLYDRALNMVMEQLASAGIKDLTVNASSLFDIHMPLMDHMRNGVVTGLITDYVSGGYSSSQLYAKAPRP